MIISKDKWGKLIKWCLLGAFLFVLGFAVVFWRLFHNQQSDCDKLFYYTFRAVPYENKSHRLFSYISADQSKKVFLSKMRIKARGGSSADYPKHNFTIELPQKMAIAGLPRDDDWILSASYIDRSFLRHKLSFDLFMQFSEDNIAPKTEYIEVYRNFRYHGLYVFQSKGRNF